MEPFLKSRDLNMFYRQLDSASVYFEYGSGGSTYQAAIRPNITAIYSVESDKEWHDTLKNKIENADHIKFIHIEMDTKPNKWGYPGPNATNEQKIQYSEQLGSLTESERQKIDLVFIDGRFRVACCLKCFDIISDNCIIAFDDFLNRQSMYREVLNYYNVIEKTLDNTMVLLKKKSDISSVPTEIIEKYELDAR